MYRHLKTHLELLQSINRVTKCVYICMCTSDCRCTCKHTEIKVTYYHIKWKHCRVESAFFKQADWALQGEATRCLLWYVRLFKDIGGHLLKFSPAFSDLTSCGGQTRKSLSRAVKDFLNSKISLHNCQTEYICQLYDNGKGNQTVCQITK